MSEIDAVDALSTVLLSDVPTVPDYFFQAYTGSTIHLVWSSMDGSGLGGCVNASFSQQFCFGLRSQLPPAFPKPLSVQHAYVQGGRAVL
jgi:hypothetical protein